MHRLRASARTSPVRIRSAELPDRAFPRVSELLERSGQACVDAALQATYQGRAQGWFAEEARAPTELWLTALGRALRTGAYDTAIEASAAFMRRARLGGATAVERAAFIDRFGRVLGRLLGEQAGTREETTALSRLFERLRHRALQDMS